MDAKKPKSAARAFVRYALDIGAMELTPKGRELKSGRISPYFFNSGLFNLGGSLTILARAYAAAVQQMGSIDICYGPPYKGVPLCTAVVLALYGEYGTEVGYAFHRKEEKDHGDKGIFVGFPVEGRRVCVVDDVMTTSKSIEDAFGFILKGHGIPVGCVVGFDRQERRSDDSEQSVVQAFRNKHGVPVHAAATLADLVAELEEEDTARAREILPFIFAYRERYGAVL